MKTDAADEADTRAGRSPGSDGAVGSGGPRAAGPDQPPDDDERRLRRRLTSVRHRIVVLSGKGGVGKSTVAVNLAVALAGRGFATGLLDVDVHGPSVPIMLGLEDARPSDQDDVIVPVEFASNLKVMSIGFLLPSRDDPVIWRGPLKYSLIRQFLTDVKWGELDYLVVDAPPGTGDEPLSVIQLLQDLDGAVIVTTPQKVALRDVRRCMRFCAKLDCRVLGVIENMSGLVCPNCGTTIDVFRRGGGEALAREAGVPFLGAVPLEPELVQAGDEGRPYMAALATSPAADAFRRAIEPLLALDDG